MCQDMRCWELVELGLGELRGGLWAQAGQPESLLSASSSQPPTPHPETRRAWKTRAKNATNRAARVPSLCLLATPPRDQGTEC